MINLEKTYNTIQNLLCELSEFDTYSAYQDNLNYLTSSINDLYKYFGVRTLKIDIGDFHKYEVVKIIHDEGGFWIAPLDDKTDKRRADLFDYMIAEEKIFY